MAEISKLDAHEQPSEYLRSRWKAYAKATPDEWTRSLAADVDEIPPHDIIMEASRLDETPTPTRGLRQVGSLPRQRVDQTFRDFMAGSSPDDTVESFSSFSSFSFSSSSSSPSSPLPIFAHPLLPGLLVVPGLVPPAVQSCLLNRLVHRDLSCPLHQTNLHLHYDPLPYPPDGASFFDYPPDANRNNSAARAQSAATFRPRDPAVNKSLSISQVLERRLHWVTLGGQYDWTRRVYVNDNGDSDGSDEAGDAASRIPFPPDIARLVEGLFPETAAQAAIVNFYTPGDTMMMHRDVSEHTDKGLVSLSMGCDALFMAAPTREFLPSETPDAAGDKDENQDENKDENKDKPYVLLRLRSGDAIYMSSHARFSWHGVPKVFKDTCPDYLADWPAGIHDSDGRYEAWRGWMRNKRINLNVRQMRD